MSTLYFAHHGSPQSQDWLYQPLPLFDHRTCGPSPAVGAEDGVAAAAGVDVGVAATRVRKAATSAASGASARHVSGAWVHCKQGRVTLGAQAGGQGITSHCRGMLPTPATYVPGTAP